MCGEWKTSFFFAPVAYLCFMFENMEGGLAATFTSYHSVMFASLLFFKCVYLNIYYKDLQS